ncbi:glycosyltransferase family 39 protein [Candidatus Sumerlaeota bacterium]|nr:glycosyltransferase family 39 protein [Candidatus Sumerlaeota bacterium]
MSRRATDALAVAALLVLFAAVHLAWDDPWGADLLPAPDAMECVAIAESWLAHGLPAIELSDGALYPPRYALGYPAALALWRAITGGGQTSALVLNQLLSAVVIAMIYLVGRHLAGREGAFAAAVLATLSFKMADLAELAMTEPLAMVIVLAITGIAVARAGSGGRPSAIAIGALAGFLCTIRLTHVITLAYLLPMALLLRRRGIWADFKWGLVGFAPWMVAVALSQRWLNGSIWRQGYDLWAPYATALGQGWSWRYLVSPPPVDIPGIADLRFLPHWQTYPPMLLGLPLPGIGCIFYGWPVALGIVWAVIAERSRLRRRWAWAVLGGLAVYLIVWSLYYFWASRFFAPLIPLALLLGCRAIAPRWREGLSAANLVRIALLAIALWIQISTLVHYLGLQRPWTLSERQALIALDEVIPPDAVVIIDAYATLARSELESDERPRRVLCWAIDGRDQLLFESRLFGVDSLRRGDGRASALFAGNVIQAHAQAEVERAWAEGREVWVVLHRPTIEAGETSTRWQTLEAERGTLFSAVDSEDMVHRAWRWETEAGGH